MKKMKKLNLSILVPGLVMAGLTLATANAGSWNVDVKESKLEWIGRKITGSHNGIVKISEGSLQESGDELKGTFTMDMTTIRVDDIEDPEYNQKLTGHLKNEDFFDVTKHPKSQFVLVKAVKSKDGKKYDVEGDLIIKGIKNRIQFPATIEKKGEVLTATATFKVDRTKWNIRYGSDSFFDNLGDKAIDNDMEFTVHLKADKSEEKAEVENE